MVAEHEFLDAKHLRSIEELVRTYLKVAVRTKFVKYCYACEECKKQPLAWTLEKVVHIDVPSFDKLPRAYQAFVIGHEFHHAKHFFFKDCAKANEHSADLLRRAGMPEEQVRKVLGMWLADAVALEGGKLPSWAL